MPLLMTHERACESFGYALITKPRFSSRRLYESTGQINREAERDERNEKKKKKSVGSQLVRVTCPSIPDVVFPTKSFDKLLIDHVPGGAYPAEY